MTFKKSLTFILKWFVAVPIAALVGIIFVTIVVGFVLYDSGEREWVLKDGTHVHFYHISNVTDEDYDLYEGEVVFSPGLSETTKHLDVTYPDGAKEKYTFSEWHAGFSKVELWASPDHSSIWIVDRDGATMAAKLHLQSGLFVPDEIDFCFSKGCDGVFIDDVTVDKGVKVPAAPAKF